MNTFTKDFSDEEIARDWTLSDFNLEQITEFRKSYQLYAAVQRVFNSFARLLFGFGSGIIAAHH